MRISRRRFIKASSLTVVAASFALEPRILAFAQQAAAGTSQGFQIPITAQQEPAYMFTRGTFEPYIGSIFQAPNARGQMVSLKLRSVTSFKPSTSTKLSTAKARDTDSFSLMFQASEPLPEFTSIHKVSHPALGTFDLFLSPHSSAKERIYEAVFNHI